MLSEEKKFRVLTLFRASLILFSFIQVQLSFCSKLRSLQMTHELSSTDEDFVM